MTLPLSLSQERLLRDICTMAESLSSPIADFFKDRSVLITGATGFVGKVLVEKLLRSCSKIKTIYVLLRPKRGKEPKDRLAELFKMKLFEQVLKEQPGCISKVVPIHGDLILPELGISDSDQELLTSNVSIVFHSAASVKFDEPLNVSIKMNVVGTQSVIELCRKMVHLEALIHVSTAFSNCNRKEIAEIVYDSPVSPKEIIDTIEWMDENMVNLITPHLLKGRPNTYTYAKSLCESLLLEESKSLQIAIVRPSIVTSTWKEPFPGWVDNFNGTSGLTMAICKGFLHSMYGYTSCMGDMIPVDVVSNLMICVAWNIATHKPSKLLVYNCCSSNINPVAWLKYEEILNHFILNFPNSDLFFYPSFKLTGSRLLYKLRVLLYHLLPAYALDFAAMITGRKRRLVRLYEKLHKAVDCMEFFTSHDSKFEAHNVPMLLQKITPEDKQVFYFDLKTINWSSYLENCFLGIRQFLLKDELSTIPLAREKLKRKYIIGKAVHLVLLFLLWKLVVMMF